MTNNTKEPHTSAQMLTLTPSLSNKQRNMLNLAVKAAQTSEHTWKHGAVVVKSGRVLSIGINKQRNAEMQNYAKQYETCFTVHAEVDALSRIPDANGVTIYIARVNKHGEERYSAPCENCAKYLAKRGVKNIIYTTGY